ncbi:MAG: response regulator [Verrucomicrobia bacterium]|nr:response regulator [Verrucomicrobiota bacterium]
MNPAPRKSVVLIDDEVSYTNLLKELLSEQLDCPIIPYARPLEALANLPELNPGVIVTDYSMPQLNGAEFIVRASALFPGVPIILITGNPDGSVNRDELAKLPALKAILLKPFCWRLLRDEIIRLWPEPGAQLRRHEVSAASV